MFSVCELLPKIKAGQNLEFQLSKSSTAPALNNGEARQQNRQLILYIK